MSNIHCQPSKNTIINTKLLSLTVFFSIWIFWFASKERFQFIIAGIIIVIAVMMGAIFYIVIVIGLHVKICVIEIERRWENKAKKIENLSKNKIRNTFGFCVNVELVL